MAMLKVGLTGGIGSGKSTVAAMFGSFGVPVYDSDNRARWLQENDPYIVARMTELFGDKAYLPGGKLDSAFIASVVFNDAAALQKLNEIVHPAVKLDFAKWSEEQEKNNASYIIKEAAILIESGLYKDLDKIIVVTAPEELRIERVAKRDNTNAEQVKKRILSQMKDAEKASYADYIIVADDRQPLIPQVVNLHQKLMETAKSGNFLE